MPLQIYANSQSISSEGHSISTAATKMSSAIVSSFSSAPFAARSKSPKDQQAMSRSHRIMLEHIAETWYRIADSLPANDA
jgi:hypothetical protein